jgi:hypothetical protein
MALSSTFGAAALAHEIDPLEIGIYERPRPHRHASASAPISTAKKTTATTGAGFI